MDLETLRAAEAHAAEYLAIVRKAMQSLDVSSLHARALADTRLANMKLRAADRMLAPTLGACREWGLGNLQDEAERAKSRWKKLHRQLCQALGEQGE